MRSTTVVQRGALRLSKTVMGLLAVVLGLTASVANAQDAPAEAATKAAATPAMVGAVPGAPATAGIGGIIGKPGSPFTALKGSWSGNGLIQLENGASEAIRCRAYYTTKSAGQRLGMSIRCASPSNKFDLRAGLDMIETGTINGTWEERTFNANGTAAGQASGTSMRLDIDGTLKGTVSVILDGRSQHVSIYSDNTGLNGVTIRFRKAGAS